MSQMLSVVFSFVVVLLDAALAFISMAPKLFACLNYHSIFTSTLCVVLMHKCFIQILVTFPSEIFLI